MELNLSARTTLLKISVRGAIGRSDFSALAVVILAVKAETIYLDWVDIERWVFKTTKEDIAIWREAGKCIRRIALLHDSSLNRQAAWLSAVLRGEGTCVRSWRSQLAAEAEEWLSSLGSPPSDAELHIRST